MQPEDIHAAFLIFKLTGIDQLYSIDVEYDESDQDWLKSRQRK